MPAFSEFGLLANTAYFTVAAAIVWVAGSRIARYADVISAKTGLGQALLGVLLLGGVTSLPELAVTMSASLGGNSALAVNNILGGVTMQVAILALADFASGRRALSSVVPNPVVLLQAGLNIMLLAVVAIATLVGDVAVAGAGLWAWGIIVLFGLAIRILAAAGQREPWRANISDAERRRQEKKEDEISARKEGEESLRSVIAKTVVAGLLILAAGYVVAKSGEAIARQSGLGDSFFGAVFVAISTSLPELSTVLAAVRLGLFTMAVSDILGTNLFDTAMLFLVDITAPGEPVLATVGPFATVAALLGMLVTALFLVGLAERREWTVLRMGVDSAAILVAYLGGIVLLYTLR